MTASARTPAGFAALAGCIFHVQIAPRAGSGALRGGRSSNPDAEGQTP